MIFLQCIEECSVLNVPFLPLDISVLQKSVLDLEVFVLQHPVLQLDVSVPQQPLLLLDVSVLSQPLLSLDVSVLQQPLPPLDVSVSQQPLLSLETYLLYIRTTVCAPAGRICFTVQQLVLHLNLSVYKSLCCTCRYLSTRALVLHKDSVCLQGAVLHLYLSFNVSL